MPKLTPQEEIEVTKRRTLVAGLYLNRFSQMEIAAQLNVSQPTVARDLAALKAQWKREASGKINARIAREAAELDAMERDCCLQFSKSKDRTWLETRLRIKERRAKLFGFDAPTKLTINEIDAIIDAAAGELTKENGNAEFIN
jgi:predicted XRE-type DNA-binding protein